MLIIFDYDGVIVDSFGTVHDIYKGLCAELGLSCPEDVREFHRIMDDHYLQGYERLGIVGPLVEQADAIFAREVVKRDPKVFPHVREMLEALSQEHTLVLVTATIREEIDHKLEMHGLQGFFTKVVISDEFAGKDRAFMHVMRELVFSADQTISVGDRKGDYVASREAGISRIILTRYGWGFDETKTPDAIIVERPEELLDTIRKTASASGNA